MNNSHLPSFFTRVSLLGAVLMMILIAAPLAQAAITVQNYYRMGENDPGAAIGVAATTRDGVGTKHLTLNGGPFYSADVSAVAAARVGSSFSMNFFSGAPNASGVLLSNVTDNFGLEAWVKPTTTSGNRCFAYNGNTGSSGWGIFQVGNTFQGLFGGVAFFGSSPVTLNTWTHVALVRNVGTTTLYVNGVASGTTTATPNVPVGSFGVGAGPPAMSGDFISGLVDEVRFFTFTAGQFTTNDLLVNAFLAPTVTTLSALSGVFSTNETLFATANAQGSATTVSFEYGLTTSYGSSVVAANLAAGASTVAVTTVLSGLTPGTLYHYRVVATNSGGTSTGTDKTFTTRNDNLEVRAHYRLGELDGTNYAVAAAGSESVSLIDSVGNHHVPVINSGTFGDATITAQPTYSSNVGTTAAIDTGSSRSMDTANGNAYGLVGVFYPGVDNFCLEAWVKAGSLSGFQFITYNGGTSKGWGLSLDNGVYKASTRNSSFSNYTGEDFGYAPASLTEWTHLALVSNNGVVTFYANGLPAGSPAHPLNLQGGNFTLGTGPIITSRFHGQLDEVRISTFPSGQFNITSLLLKSIPPAVTSPTSTSITGNSAVLGGTVTGQGGPAVTERGIVYSANSVNGTPVIGGAGVTKVIVAGSTGVFTTAVTGLTSSTAYAFRAYATSTVGTTYGSVAGFSTGFTPLIHYRLGEIDPGATAGGAATNTLDSLGTNHLALTGTPTYSADTAPNQGSLLSLNCSNGVAYGSRPLWPLLTDNFGFEVWVKPSTDSGTHYILYNGNPGSSGWGVLQNGGGYQVLFGGQVAFGSAPVTVNQWTHLAVVRDGGVSTFYVNGIASGTTTTAPVIPGGNFGFVLGADPGVLANSRWAGSLDQVRLFNFPPGQFSLTNLLLLKPEVALEQPAGSNLTDGGSQDFGGVTVGSNTSLTFTLRNTGNANLTGLVPTLDGAHAGQFSVTTSPVAPVAAGGSTTFIVRFTPTSFGAKTAVLHLTTNDPDENPFDLTLTGTGLGPEIGIEQPAGTALADGGSRDFGSVNTGSGTTLTFTVQNTGNAALLLTGTPKVTVSGTHAADFTVAAQPISPVSGSDAVGLTNAGFETPVQSANGFTYNPAGTGWTFGSSVGVARNGSPWFVNAAPEGLQAAFIQNSGANASLSRTVNFPGAGNYVIRFSLVRRSALDLANDIEVRMDGTTLGSVPNNSQPDDTWRTFTVAYNCPSAGPHLLAFVGMRNDGNSALDDVQVSGTTTFQITFSPTAGGARTASLSIANNDGDETPYDLTLTGTGVLAPEIAVFTGASTAPGDERTDNIGTNAFASTAVGSSSAAQTFTLKNAGTFNLTGLALTKTGANTGDFTLGSLGATTLAPNATTTFTVIFSPTASGARSAVVAIASNDGDENPFEINVSGTGVPVQEIAVEQPSGTAIADGGSRDFGSVNTGAGTTLTFTLRNTGTAELLLTGTPKVAVSGAHAADFTVTAQPASPVLGSGEAVIILTNAGFETPAYSPGGFTYNPGGTGWTFGSTAGLARNDSPWFVNVAPEGLQAAFIQRNGSGDAAATLSRTINFPGTGTYGIRFSMVRRGSGLQATDISVRMDGTTLGTVLNTEQPDDVWRTFTVTYNCTVVGNHTLAFVGTRTGGDYASALDDVQILGATTFQVAFAPTAGGQRTATLSIANNDGDENPYDITLTGTGVLAPEINVQGNAVSITDGDTTPATADHTDFGGVSLASGTIVRTFTLQNTGTADLTIGAGAITVTGGHAVDFTVGGITLPATIAAAGSTTFTVTFDPSAAGTRSTTVNLVNNDSDEATYDFAIQGTGVGLPIAQWVANDWTGGTANWVDRVGGKIATAYGNATLASGQFTGNAATAGLVFDGVDDYFEVVAAQNPMVGKKSVTIVALFKATQGATGSDGAFWQNPGPINGEAPGNPNDFGLTYNSAGQAQAFFNDTISQASPVSVIDGQPHTLMLTWSDTDVGDGTARFYVDGVLKGSLVSDTSVGLVSTALRFGREKETNNRWFRGTLGELRFYDTIETPAALHTLMLTPVPEIAVQQPLGTDLADGGTLGFGNVNLGANADRTFTITNSGAGALTGLGITVDGTDAAQFTVTANPTGPVSGPGGSTTFTVRFAPTSTGAKTAALHIASNDGDENPYDITIQGTGLTVQETWRQTYFGTTANSGMTADSFDFDQDGIVNLIEYAFGLNPTLANSSEELPQSDLSGGNFTLSFTQPSGVTGITYGAESSATLLPGSWTAIPDTGSGNTHIFSVPTPFNAPDVNERKIFIRLVVTAP